MLENKTYFTKYGDIVVSEKNGKQVATVNGKRVSILKQPWGIDVKIGLHYVTLAYTNLTNL